MRKPLGRDVTQSYYLFKDFVNMRKSVENDVHVGCTMTVHNLVAASVLNLLLNEYHSRNPENEGSLDLNVILPMQGRP